MTENAIRKKCDLCENAIPFIFIFIIKTKVSSSKKTPLDGQDLKHTCLSKGMALPFNQA